MAAVNGYILNSVESDNSSAESDSFGEKRKPSKQIPDKVQYNTKFTTPLNKKRKRFYDPEEEARLERLVFGDHADVLNNLLSSEDKTNVVTSPIGDESAAAAEADEASDSADDSEPGDDSPEDIQSDENNDLVEASNSDQNDGSDSTDDSDEDVSDSLNIDSGFEAEHVEGKRRVAWFDEDDTTYNMKKGQNLQGRRLPVPRPEATYEEVLRNNYKKLVGTPKWAKLQREKKKDSDDDSDSEILRHSNYLETPKVTKLPRGTIDMKPLKNLNQKTRTEGPLITSVQFHPSSTVALVAGTSGILSLFQVDGRENTKLHSMQYHKFPINTARFTKEGSEVVVGSHKHAHCHAYDLLAGKTFRIPLPHGMTNMKKFEVSPDGKFIAVIGRMGEIHLLTSSSKEMIKTFKMNDPCNSLAFTPDSNKLITHGDGGEMYVWDIKEQTCFHRAIDDGCLSGTCIAVSPSGQFLATGSKQGVVNLYDVDTFMKTNTPQPSKIILNLVTSISSLKFNPASEILALSSNEKENAIKMLHLPSATIFSNFPTFQTKIGNPTALDFSPGSAYMGITNNHEQAYLYRLKHYGNY